MANDKSYNRKQVLIDKKYQVRTTLSIVGIVTIVMAIFIGAITLSVVYNNAKIENIYKIENNIMQFLTSRPFVQSKAEIESYKKAMKTVSAQHRRNMSTLDNIMLYNRFLLIALFVLVLAEGLILTLLLIRKTHKVSGPVYVMTMYMNQIIDGKWPMPRKLREKDELQDFYETFRKMVDTLKNRYDK